MSHALQTAKRYLSSDRDFNDVKTERSVGYASIKPTESFRSIGYYDTDSLDRQQRLSINRKRFKQNDVQNLYSNRNSTAKFLGMLHADEKDLGNPETDILATISKLRNIYGSDIPSDSKIISSFKGAPSAKTEYQNYKSNYSEGKSNSFKGVYSTISDFVTKTKNLYNTGKKELIEKLEKELPAPLQFEAFAADQVGIKQPLTEHSLSEEQLKYLTQRAYKALRETHGLIGYDDSKYTP